MSIGSWIDSRSTRRRLIDPSAMRLIDLHVDWLLQYSGEATVFDPAWCAQVPQRLGQVEGYLQDTTVAVLSCYRSADDWSHHADPWRALADLVTRYEAEFSGRLLQGPEDLKRWSEEPESLCWGVLGVEGFDAVIRTASDLDRLPQLFERGVRLFQPVYTSSSALGGSSADGDDRGITELGKSFLDVLAGLSRLGARPVFDLAHLNPKACGEALAWFEADSDRAQRVIPVYSHGAPVHEGFARPRAITSENVRRLRALGGFIGFSVGPPFFHSPGQLKAALESVAAHAFDGQPGFQGIAIGTDFLGVDRTLPELGNMEKVVGWIAATFEQETAGALVSGNGKTLLKRMLGRDDPSKVT